MLFEHGCEKEHASGIASYDVDSAGSARGNAARESAAAARGCTASRIRTNTAGKRVANVVLSAVLVASFALSAPAAALASSSSEQDAVDAWLDAAETSLNDPSYETFSYAYASDEAEAAAIDSGSATTASTLPDSFDLRTRGVVTPVKQQDPWGTCWGFSAIAAAETSILSESGKTYEQTGLDLSERQLAWFTFSQTQEKYVGAAQAGEGFNNTSKDPNFGLNLGGFELYASSIFASGIGPLLEKTIPYQNEEGIRQCTVTRTLDDGTQDVTEEYLTAAEVEQLKSQGATVQELKWAGNYFKMSDDGQYTTNYTTWKVDDSLWNQSILELEHGYILPEPRKFDDYGQYIGIDDNAINAIKQQMSEYGRAISVYYNSNAIYTKYPSGPNEPCTHYAYETVGTNHVVTIVGWDDNFSRGNFADDSGHTPEGDGAWLVKNSWGAQTNGFPNSGTWGTTDAEGYNTGYFWLSYYDRSAASFESFDFDLNSYGDSDEYLIDQYDYLAQRGVISKGYKQKVSTANIFKADEDRAVRTLSCQTYKPNTTVTYEVYLLSDDAKNPTDASAPVLTKEVEYAYGGYHRTTLDEADWIAMREGQRYSVVVTQKCADDGKYYMGVGYNETRPSDKEIEANRTAKKEEIERQMLNQYASEYLEKYIGEGMSYEEAQAKAEADAKAKVATSEVQEKINANVEEALDTLLHCYFVAKVNDGESWTTAPQSTSEDEEDQGEGKGSTGDEAAAAGEAVVQNDPSDLDDGDEPAGTGEWVDWTVARKAVDYSYGDVVTDNFSIKAFAEIRDWASVESLDELKARIAEAKAALDAAQISADGTDVAEGQTWMTQDEHDALAAAIEAAEEQMELAGEGYATTLASTTPAQQAVDDALSALTWDAKPGTMATADGGDAQGNAATKGKLAKTGDPAALVLAIALGAAACGAAALAARRKRERF